MDGADRPPKRLCSVVLGVQEQESETTACRLPCRRPQGLYVRPPQHHPDHHRRRARQHRAPGQRRRLPRRQQGQPGNPQLLHEPRLPRRPRPVQARGVGARLHPQPAVRLHPGHRRLRPRRHGHARRQARLRPRPQRYRTAAEGFRRPRAGHLLETGPDRQGQGLAERAEGRHADSEVAIGTTEQRADLPADIRRRAAHLEGRSRTSASPPGAWKRPRSATPATPRTSR